MDEPVVWALRLARSTLFAYTLVWDVSQTNRVEGDKILNS